MKASTRGGDIPEVTMRFNDGRILVLNNAWIKQLTVTHNFYGYTTFELSMLIPTAFWTTQSRNDSEIPELGAPKLAIQGPDV